MIFGSGFRWEILGSWFWVLKLAPRTFKPRFRTQRLSIFLCFLPPPLKKYIYIYNYGRMTNLPSLLVKTLSFWWESSVHTLPDFDVFWRKQRESNFRNNVCSSNKLQKLLLLKLSIENDYSNFIRFKTRRKKKKNMYLIK